MLISVKRRDFRWWVFPAAHLASGGGFLLAWLGFGNPAIMLLVGMLLGLSMAGNLACLYVWLRG